MGSARRSAVIKFLTDLEAWAAPRTLVAVTAEDLDGFLAARLDEGFHPNTVRKWLVIARVFYRWLYDEGAITADTMLAIRDLRPPRGSSSRPQPRPHTPGELRALRDALDARWPRLTDEDARRAPTAYHFFNGCGNWYSEPKPGESAKG